MRPSVTYASSSTITMCRSTESSATRRGTCCTATSTTSIHTAMAASRTRTSKRLPRLEWENDGHYDVSTDSYTYITMNVGQTPLSSVVATVRVTQGPVGLRADHCIGWTDNGQPAGPGEAMKFTFWLDRPLTKDEEVEIELRLPDENGGATFTPGLPGFLQALARGEPLD